MFNLSSETDYKLLSKTKNYYNFFILNILILFTAIFDSDGFSIKSKNFNFPAKQFTPEYIAPEFIKKKPEETDKEQDHFALAVIIFQLL